MTEVLYRLDDKVTTSYQEYLAEKDSCENAFIFRVEVSEYNHNYKTPKTWSEIDYKVNIPFQYGMKHNYPIDLV